MKKNLLVIAGLLCATAGAFAQGSIQFNNRVVNTTTAAVVAPIYGVETANPTVAKHGNGATGPTTPIPTGTQQYSGPALVGTGFTASIWARPAGSGAAFVQAATTPFRATTSSTLFGFWTVPSTAVILPNVPSDAAVRAEILIRVWDNVGGTVTAWDTAVQRGNVAVGESLPFVVADQLGGGVVLPPTLRGLESFNLTVPEPSVIALGVLGAGCLFLLRRRK